jgi:phosphoribosyl 1,2-cyclic phosphodiesterase
MKIKFWGVRGSIPVPGESTIKYGGNTPCISITSDSGYIIILDAGTGIRELGEFLLKEYHNKSLNIFLSHTHWDHIHGLPFFIPLYDKYEINFFLNLLGRSPEFFIDVQLSPDFFPVTKGIFKSKIGVNDIIPGQKITAGDLCIDTCEVFHSKGTLSFKVIENGKSIVYMTDNEIQFDSYNAEPDLVNLKERNLELIEFCKDCDFLIHDSMYTYLNFENKKGWGHSNNEVLAYFSYLANVKNLVLFHYEPTYNDKKIDLMVQKTKEILNSLNPNIKCIPSIEKDEIIF